MLTADRVLPTRVGVAPGTTTFTLGDPELCDRGARATVQKMRFLPTLLRAAANRIQEAACACAPALIPPPSSSPASQPRTLSPNQLPQTMPAPIQIDPTMTNILRATIKTNAPIVTDPSMPRMAIAYSPYETIESLKGVRGFWSRMLGSYRVPGRAMTTYPTAPGLGYILNTGPTANGQSYAEIVQTSKNYGPGSYCGTYDKLYHTRGTRGFYYDSQVGGGLGRIPSDLQLSRIRGYTPVVSSWIPFVGQTWAPPPWVPPNGTWTPDGIRPVGPMISKLQMPLAGPIGEEVPTTPVTYDAGQAAVAELKRHQDRVFALSVVSTLAIASTAVINVFKHLEDTHKRRKKEERIETLSPTAPIAGWFGGRRRRRGRR